MHLTSNDEKVMGAPLHILAVILIKTFPRTEMSPRIVYALKVMTKLTPVPKDTYHSGVRELFRNCEDKRTNRDDS